MAKQKLKPAEVKTILYKKMVSHIGKDRAIHGDALFKSIFGIKSKYNAFELLHMKRVLRSAMGSLRRNTACFIIPERRDSGWHYFVAQTMWDARIYKNLLDRNIKGCKRMAERVDSLVANKEWKNYVEELAV